MQPDAVCETYVGLHWLAQENECMRLEMEHLLHGYGADIVLQGHVHSCTPPTCIAFDA